MAAWHRKHQSWRHNGNNGSSGIAQSAAIMAASMAYRRRKRNGISGGSGVASAMALSIEMAAA